MLAYHATLRDSTLHARHVLVAPATGGDVLHAVALALSRKATKHRWLRPEPLHRDEKAEATRARREELRRQLREAKARG